MGIKSFKIFLLEMAISKSSALQKIDNQAEALLDHVLSVVAFDEFSNWDQTIFNVMGIIYNTADKSKTKISKDKIFDILYDRYIHDVDIVSIAKRLSMMKEMNIKSLDNVNEHTLKLIYHDLVYTNLASRADVRTIFNKHLNK